MSVGGAVGGAESGSQRMPLAISLVVVAVRRAGAGAQRFSQLAPEVRVCVFKCLNLALHSEFPQPARIFALVGGKDEAARTRREEDEAARRRTRTWRHARGGEEVEEDEAARTWRQGRGGKDEYVAARVRRRGRGQGGEDKARRRTRW